MTTNDIKELQKIRRDKVLVGLLEGGVMTAKDLATKIGLASGAEVGAALRYLFDEGLVKRSIKKNKMSYWLSTKGIVVAQAKAR